MSHPHHPTGASCPRVAWDGATVSVESASTAAVPAGPAWGSFAIAPEAAILGSPPSDRRPGFLPDAAAIDASIDPGVDPGQGRPEIETPWCLP